jgi:hypothetical protein
LANGNGAGWLGGHASIMAVEKAPSTPRRAPARRFRRVPVSSLHEEVVRAFCDALLTGRIKPG